MIKNYYLPIQVRIQNIVKETPDVKTFRLACNLFDYKPGQFLELSLFGFGEAPISITSTPTQKGFIEISVKKMGKLTTILHSKKKGEEIGIRGPYGNGFPLELLAKRNLLFVGGGIGLAPLRSLINYCLDNRKKYGEITILYGARTPGDIVFKNELRAWRRREGVNVLLTADIGKKGWRGNVGVVTTLFSEIEINPQNTTAIVCGPPVMIPFVIKGLVDMKMKDKYIITTLERYMKCGIGKCGHCNIGPKYTCTDGPVFTYEEMKTLEEEF